MGGHFGPSCTGRRFGQCKESASSTTTPYCNALEVYRDLEPDAKVNYETAIAALGVALQPAELTQFCENEFPIRNSHKHY